MGQAHLPPAAIEARQLYAAGHTVDQIADVLGVSRSTVFRWRRTDSQDWDSLRQTNTTADPTQLLAKLDAKIADLIDAPEDKADSLQKLVSVRDRLAARYDDIATRLDICHAIASFARDDDGTSEEEFAIFVRVLERYLSQMRAEASR